MARSIAASSAFTCALLVDGETKCWGVNNAGQLGCGRSQSERCEFDTPYPVVYPTMPVRMNAEGPNMPAVQVITAHAGVDDIGSFGYWQFSCALLIDGRVKCWGDNSYGQLGSH